MNKEFIPYEQALALKELGFDEPCFAWYVSKEHGLELGSVLKSDLIKEGLLAPTYSAAFRWFREKYDLDIEIERKWKYSSNHNPTETFIRFSIYNFKLDRESREYILFISTSAYNTYEEAELECLKKLIEIVKEQK